MLYHPDGIVGRKSRYDDMLRTVWYVVMQDKVDESYKIEINDRDIEVIEKALKFIQMVSIIDPDKQLYSEIYKEEVYFKLYSENQFKTREVADINHISRKQVHLIIDKCNNLIHKFLLSSQSQEAIELLKEYNVDYKNIVQDYHKPYFGFCDIKYIQQLDDIATQLKII